MIDKTSSQTVPFTDVGSDFMKLVTFVDNEKSTLVDFTATDFASLRTALLNYIKLVYPLDYNNFVESDLGLMLAELVAYMGTVMSMKADMLAHENFLQTAKDRDSVRKLFQLVGVSMKGPTSAQATANLSIEGETGTLDEDLVIPTANRVITVTSPQDQQPLNFTLYKATNGIVPNLTNTNADIVFDQTNWVGDSSSTWEAVMLEGAFATQTGTFSNVGVAQSIILNEAPVIQNSVQVFVSGVNSTTSGAYRQVENIYQASSTNDKIFQVVYLDNYKAKLVFGDGSNGKSPTPNSSYIVTYRVGGGTRGNVPNAFINSILEGATYNASPSSLRVTQSQMSTGGSEAETVAHAKKYGPLSFKQQDRLVSLEDYTSFASNYVGPAGSVAKAVASTRKAFSSANIIDIFVLEKATDTQLQKASISFKNGLLTAIEPKKMVTDDVVISDGLIRTLDLIITAHVDRSLQGLEKSIVANVSQSVREYFMSDALDFGDSIIFADLMKTVFGIPEVRFAEINNFDENITVGFNEVIQLNNLVVNINYV
jgi:hypothetical protein